MLIDPARLKELADATKTAIVGYYVDNDLALPERRVVLPGLPAADCDMLGIHVVRVYPHNGNIGAEATPTFEGDGAFYMRGAIIAVYLVRCLPGMRKVGQQRVAPPTVADEEAVAELILADPVHMWRALGEALDDGALPGCGGIAWEAWESVTPQGGLGGGTLTYRVSLE